MIAFWKRIQIGSWIMEVMIQNLCHLCRPNQYLIDLFSWTVVLHFDICLKTNKNISILQINSSRDQLDRLSHVQNDHDDVCCC